MSKERAAQLVDAGIWLKLSGDLDGARRLFERALKLDPTNEKARQLASPSGAEPAVAPDSSAAVANPFEPERGSSPSSLEREWGMVTGAAPGQGLPPTSSKKSAAPPAASSTLMFAMPPEVRPAQPAPAENAAAITLDFAMPEEVRTALGDDDLPRTSKFSAMPSIDAAIRSAEDELQALADREVTAPSRHIDRATLRAPPVAAEPSVVVEPSLEAESSIPDLASSPPGGTMRFARPREVTAALEPQAGPTSLPTGTLMYALPSQVRERLAAAESGDDEFGRLADEAEDSTSSQPMPRAPIVPSHAPPSFREEDLTIEVEPPAPPVMRSAPAKAAMGLQTLPTGTLVYALPSQLKEHLAAVDSADDAFGRLADDAADVPSRGAPPPSESIDLDDWGQLTDEPARAASVDSFAATRPGEGGPPPSAFGKPPSSPVETTQFAMPREVERAAGPRLPASTLQFAMPAVGVPGFTSASQHAVPQTISLSGELSPQAPETVRLTGDAPPPLPPKATPPLFSPPAGGAVVLEGSAPPPSPPAATPPMFSPAPDPLQAFAADVLPARTGRTPRPQAPAEGAWEWKSSSPPPQVALDDRPVPRPSPTLDPKAQSAWDQRSNPGIKLEAVVGADRAMDLLSSDSKIQRDPAKAKQDEIAAILRSARDLLDLDDHTGAMELISKAEKLAPDSLEVRELKERSERTLLAMFESKLGHLEKLPRVLLKDDEIIWLNLDHRAGFLLAQIDGQVTFDDLFAVSGMSRLDTARILAQLVDEGVISRG